MGVGLGLGVLHDAMPHLEVNGLVIGMRNRSPHERLVTALRPEQPLDTMRLAAGAGQPDRCGLPVRRRASSVAAGRTTRPGDGRPSFFDGSDACRTLSLLLTQHVDRLEASIAARTVPPSGGQTAASHEPVALVVAAQELVLFRSVIRLRQKQQVPLVRHRLNNLLDPRFLPKA